MNEYRVRYSDYYNKRYNVTIEAVEAEGLTLTGGEGEESGRILAFAGENGELVAVFNDWEAAWLHGTVNPVRTESFLEDGAAAE